jgi:uncharacterized protein (UPF0548 family)
MGPLTYPEVGATRADVLPAGYHHLAVGLGVGPLRPWGRCQVVWIADDERVRTAGTAGLPGRWPSPYARWLARRSAGWLPPP